MPASACTFPLGRAPSSKTTFTGVTNNTHAAKQLTAAFSQAGTYIFAATITDHGGLTATSSVSVTVNQTFTGALVEQWPDDLASKPIAPTKDDAVFDESHPRQSDRGIA
jgi:hypothetical protein